MRIWAWFSGQGVAVRQGVIVDYSLIIIPAGGLKQLQLARDGVGAGLLIID